MDAIHIKVRGHVQGVFFRANTQEYARRLDLKGWVRNLGNGTVEILAVGEKDHLEQLLEWCHEGPSGAYVTEVEHEWVENKENFTGFNVRH
ncbi:acylphosphatase [Candidatus Micrarchaeota archaeon]|nr:acylphosphatase [Candidatus Micrarchaeota archaeon]